MTPRSFLDFFKSPSGKLLLFAGVLGGGLALYGHFRDQITVPTLSSFSRTNRVDEPQVGETALRPMDLFRPLQETEPSATRKTLPPERSVSPPPAPAAKVEPPPISLVADVTAGKPRTVSKSEVYAPFGRLIPCETIITVDSSSIRTPIVGLITEDVFHGGKLIIPAGTEVHGSAQVDHTRERIASDTAWTLVWQSGLELPLRAMALDREFENTTNHVGWGVTDGSAGLRGRLIRSDDFSEVKLFAATFLSGAAKALTEKEHTLLGTTESRSLNNAPFKGAEEVLGVYASRILDSIQRDGFYIRVSSGKEFYLYVLQAIDLGSAHFPSASEEKLTDSDNP